MTWMWLVLGIVGVVIVALTIGVVTGALHDIRAEESDEPDNAEGAELWHVTGAGPCRHLHQRLEVTVAADCRSVLAISFTCGACGRRFDFANPVRIGLAFTSCNGVALNSVRVADVCMLPSDEAETPTGDNSDTGTGG